jgi:hypothetical protein
MSKVELEKWHLSTYLLEEALASPQKAGLAVRRIVPIYITFGSVNRTILPTTPATV